MVAAALVVLAGTLAWVLVSRVAGRVSVTAPILMTALGLLVAVSPVDPAVDIALDLEPVRLLVELTLAMILFADASHISARWFEGRPARLALRLLAIGLPLTIAAGVLAGWALFPGAALAVVAVLAAALAPTDAALGASVMQDTRIPRRLRDVINVESGLNDGLATPVVLFFLAVAVAEDDRASVASAVVHALVQIGLAVLIGVAVGWLGGRLLVLAHRRGWSEPEQEPLAALAIALGSYVVSVGAGGNGFVAAFVAGVAFGTAVRGARPAQVMAFTDRVGLMLSFVVWFLFGAQFLPIAAGNLGWQVVLYAVLSLTVVRMLPVAVSLLGSRLGRDDVVLLGWLGPRGLASIVFGLIAYEELPADQGGAVVVVITTTVLLSVVAHGLSAGPLASAYVRRAGATGSPPAPPASRRT